VKVDLGKIDPLKTGSCILVGIIKSIKVITTGKGNKMAFSTLADYNGEIEVTFFSGPWEKCQTFVEADKVAILQGKIEYQKDKDHYSFIAENYIRLQDIDAAFKENEDREREWDAFRTTWLYMADLKSGSLAKSEKGSYTVIGSLKSLREFKDKNNNDMAFGTLQDFEGDIDLVFFSKVYNDCRNFLKLDNIIAFKGSIDPLNDRKPEKPSFKVSSIADFPQLSRAASRKEAASERPPQTAPEEKPKEKDSGPQEIHIKLTETACDGENLYPLRDFLAENSGRCPVVIHVPITGGEKKIRAVNGLAYSVNSEENLKKYGCVAEVWSK
jgi:DNA polymerase-3 subunit alpha